MRLSLGPGPRVQRGRRGDERHHQGRLAPVGYIEGWYVDEDVRHQGVGRTLVEAAESWARWRGCRQMASDTKLWNTISHQAHGAVGYEEIARLVLFKKDLDRAAPRGD